MSNRFKAYLVLMILASILLNVWGCAKEKVQEQSMAELYRAASGQFPIIEILKIRDCEYVLWHKGRGMVHYAGCQNPAHCFSDGNGIWGGSPTVTDTISWFVDTLIVEDDWILMIDTTMGEYSRGTWMDSFYLCLHLNKKSNE